MGNDQMTQVKITQAIAGISVIVIAKVPAFFGF
jgi:hypothetical protein